ncbi:pilus assembly protein TadG-related protein [Streptomyces sp. SCL15-4]|uniref:pilus assembly protein TadG-related protein n=1 Tax=Streptomyces sp. SCL15-4 TaxID=2967221 RepID=UPI0029675A51|nr:pilus assembly protein TadG-related protein [Streptomyces sp. SCL15-4]
MTRPRHDAGQAFPIYLTVVAGLLFLALAYLAVGQAAVNRGGAQTAADAAALAAAQETRDQLFDLWRAHVDDPGSWQDIFDGAGARDFCGRADQLAARNDATTVRCVFEPPLSYVVDTRAEKSVGDSVVPGTENVHATAHARAVIEPLCTPPEDVPEPPGPPGPPGTGTPSPGAGSASPGEGADPPEDAPLPPLTCEDKVWHPEPDDTTELPGPEDLFDVHLADSPANDR